MSEKNGHVPACRLQQPSGQARVIINHEHNCHGKYGPAESRERFARLLAEISDGRVKPALTSRASVGNPSISVNELILAYWQFAQSHYLKNGKPS